MAKTLLEMKHITKTFPGVKALDDVNIAVEEGEIIYVAPKAMDFSKWGMDEDSYAPTMGDKDFQVMLHRIADNNEIALKDAEELVKGAVKFKNRHRFNGHLMERKGSQGYIKDVAWVLYHYAGQMARYIALESNFKPQAISLFERRFGAFNEDYNNNPTAKYSKDYINDVNGNPSVYEKMLNDWLNNSDWYKNHITPRYGERAALTLTNNVVGLTSKTTLGFLSPASALLNLTQLATGASYLGGISGVKRVAKKFLDLSKRGGKPTFAELRILAETGVLSDLGLDTASGYDRNRTIRGEKFSEDIIGWIWAKTNDLLDKGMYLFQGFDMMCRLSTTLAAYDKAVAEQKSKGETFDRKKAIKYAADINRKSNFDYSQADAPNIFRRSGIFGKIMLQFYKYPIKFLGVMKDFAPYFGKKTNLTQKITFWTLQFLLTGLMGIMPLFDWFDDMLYKHFEVSPKDAIQKGIMKHLGDNEAAKLFGKTLMYGGGAVADIDVSKRVGTADLMPHSFIDFILGATGSKAVDFGKNMIKGFYLEEEGAYLSALRNISPGLYNIFSAVQGETLTSRDRRNSVYEDMYDRMLRGLGFKSVDESLSTDVQRIVGHDRALLNLEKQRAVDAFLRNRSYENLRKLKELGIKPDTVKKEAKRKELDRLNRVLEDETKKEKLQNQYLFDFAK